jgi:DNA-binding response OmpR family regulator
MSEPPIPARLLLVAESDDDLRTHLAVNLRADGYDVTQAATPAHLSAKLVIERPTLLVLGELAGVPIVTSLAAVRTGCPQTPLDPHLPVICLGPDGDELAELRTFRAGADDYIGKPISYPLLHARVQALLRRSARQRSRGRIRIGNLELDPAGWRASVDGTPVEVSRIEYQLLLRLASEPTRVWTKRELLRDVWGYRSLAKTRTVDSHACRLRAKLALAGAPNHVVNVWGIGYRLLDPVNAPARDGAA